MKLRQRTTGAPSESRLWTSFRDIGYALTLVAGMTATEVADALEPRENAVTEEVDLVEINHFYDNQGRLVFDQIIYYDWKASTEKRKEESCADDNKFYINEPTDEERKLFECQQKSKSHDVQHRYEVIAWRLLKNPGQVPAKTNGSYVSIWHDGEVLRKVKAASMRESWTQYDPELVERDHLCKDKRRELRRLFLPKKTSPKRAPATPTTGLPEGIDGL